MSRKCLGCQVLIKSCCRHPFRPRNPELCSMQKTWLEAKENHENLPENSFNHSCEACKKSDSNSKWLFLYIKNTFGTQPMSTGDRLKKKCFVYIRRTGTLLSLPSVPEGVCSVGLLGPILSMAGLRSMARLSPVNFRVTFPANFLADRFAHNFKFYACVVLAWFHPSASCPFDYISRVVGKIDVSRANEHSAYEW
ncbi:unnamed protein product [Brassica rapa subsp. trilocularis]